MTQAGPLPTQQECNTRLWEASHDLQVAYREEATIHMAERQAYDAAYIASNGESVSAREQDGRHNASPLAIDRYEIQGTIKALEEEIANLRFIVKYRLYRVPVEGQPPAPPSKAPKEKIGA